MRTMIGAALAITMAMIAPTAGRAADGDLDDLKKSIAALQSEVGSLRKDNAELRLKITVLERAGDHLLARLLPANNPELWLKGYCQRFLQGSEAHVIKTTAVPGRVDLMDYQFTCGGPTHWAPVPPR